METIAARRSVRKYEPRPVEKEKLAICVEAARLAPSACNSQPWKYITVSDPAALAALKETAFTGVYAPTAFAKQAPVLVAVVSENAGLPAWLGGKFRSLPFYLVDIGISVQNFVLAAQSQCLGTCIIGWFDEVKAAKALGVPSGRKVELLISVGYPAENPPARPRKKLEQMSSQDSY
ncbi:MAG TPA: nitroreductase family protein [Elusimicrobiales bacterium]|nr:nitroreductase family protein [Elusimicrobiales bacterium]